VSSTFKAAVKDVVSTFKAAVKDVFLSTTASNQNSSALELSRRAYVRRMTSVRRSTHLFQVTNDLS